MEAIINTFHLELKLVIAQLVNFLIVLAVLWYFALKPLMKLMTERSQQIAKSLKKAAEIEAGWIRAQAEEADFLKEARIAAENIIVEAKILAEKDGAELKAKTKSEIEQLVIAAKDQIVTEKEKARVALQGEVVDLIIAALTKLLGKDQVALGLDKKLVKEVMEHIK